MTIIKHFASNTPWHRLNRLTLMGLLIVIALLLVQIKEGHTQNAPNAPVVSFTWEYNDTTTPQGFKLYKGPAPASISTMTQIATIPTDTNNPDNTNNLTYQWVDNSEQCFGISAYNAFGESDIQITNIIGETVCLGKLPTTPTQLLFTVLPMPQY